MYLFSGNFTIENLFCKCTRETKKRFCEKDNFVFLKFNGDLYFLRIPVTFDVFNDVNQHVGLSNLICLTTTSYANKQINNSIMKTFEFASPPA